MPGFGNQSEGGNARYANIISGKFAEKVDEDTPGAKSRLNKNNETVWELNHPSVEGRIKKAFIHESDYGKTLRVTLDCDDEGIIVVNIPVESRYFDSFMNRLPNIAKAMDQVVVIKPYSFTDKETQGKRQGLTVEIGGVKIEPFYTKENTGQKPTDKAYKKLPDGRLKEADFKHFKATEREWFCELVKTVFPEGDNPKYGASENPVKAADKPVSKKPVASAKPEENLEDLPF